MRADYTVKEWATLKEWVTVKEWGGSLASLE